jgi:hypothetical protein
MKIFIYLTIFILSFSIAFSNWEILKGPGYNNYLFNGLDVDNNKIYIALIGAIYYSEDLGQSWKLINKNFDTIFSDIQLIIANKESIFISNGNTTMDNYLGVYSTTDLGTTWHFYPELPTFRKYYKNKEELFVYDDTGLLKYDVINKTWIRPYDTTKLKKINSNAFLPYKDKYYFGAWVWKEGVNKPLANITIYYKKTGDTIKICDTTSDIWKYTITSFISKDSLLFAGTTGGLFVSSNEGLNWLKKNNGLHYQDSVYSFDYEVHSLFVKDDIIYALLSGPTDYGYLDPQTFTYLAYSTNNGGSWIIPNSLIQYFRPRLLNQINNKLIITTQEGLLMVNDSLTEYENILKTQINGNSQNFTMDSNTFYSVSGYSFNNHSQGIWESTDKGENWEKLNNNLSATDLTRILVKDSIIIVSNTNNGSNPYISFDYGKTFQQISLIQNIQQPWVMSIHFYNGNFYLGTKFGIYYSKDNCKTWTELNSSISNYQIKTIEFYQNYIFAGINQSRILISSDNGQTWLKSRVNSDESERSSIVEIKVINNKIFAGTYHAPDEEAQISGHGLYMSTDFGTTWIEKNTGLPKIYGVYSITNYGNYIFLSMSDYAGVFYSTDEGETWNVYNKGLTESSIKKLIVFDNYLYASTYSGVYRVPLSDFGIVSVKDYPVEKRDYLYSMPPYPIPATNRVQVEIYWDTGLDINNAEIKIYNIYGEEISSKNSIEIIPESNWYGKLIWNCEGNEPGVYIITINYGTEKKAIKVIKN